MTSSLRRARVRAPELSGRGWLNIGDDALTLSELRGRFVLLDFWTFCCVNCLHVIDELRTLEDEFADVLVTVGVHSPKFAHEADPEALKAAVERYGVHHPVLDDPQLDTWSAYAARAWPTLVLVDPEGYVVAQMSGEGHAAGLRSLIAELATEHEDKGTLRRGDAPYVSPATIPTALRFPGKVIALSGGTFLVSDTVRHQLVELETDLVTERRRIGSGTRGLVDGDAATSAFAEPQGLALLPPDVAGQLGYDVVVADSVNHCLRAVRLASGEVVTVAGTGEPAASGLAEPSDVVVDDAGGEPLLVVVESAAHRLVRIPIPVVAQRVCNDRQQTRRPCTDLAPGTVRLEVIFAPPTGQKLDDRWGDPTRLVVSASPPQLLTAGAGSAQGLARALVLDAGSEDGVLHVSVQAAACDGDPVTGEVPEHAACHLYQQDWGIPVRIAPDGARELRLDLRCV